MPAFSLPPINYIALLPMLILFAAATVGILLEAFLPRTVRQPVQVVLSLVALLGSLGAVIFAAGHISPGAKPGVITAGDAIAVDGPALFLQGSLAVLGVVSVLLLADRSTEAGGVFTAQAGITAGTASDRKSAASPFMQTEVYPLALFSFGGMMLFVSSNDLLIMFVALEVLSLPLYLLCGMARRRRLLSQEAAVKYFLLGAFASAFFLYGVALLYGYANSVKLGDIWAAVAQSDRSPLLLLLGIGMLIIGLMFKAGVAPFHSWTPDVYQGAPTPVTALMASCTKVAAFGAILRVFYVALPTAKWDWRPLMIGIAILTMIVGAVLAITQTDIKRLLAYSSIANAGFILTGVVAQTGQGISSTMFYLVAYGFTTIGAFAIVMLVRDADGEATHLSRWAGLGKRSPLFAAVFTFFMLAFAGIPLTSGFTSKFAVFAAASGGGAVSLVILGVIASAVIAFPYLRVIVLMYLSEPAADAPTVTVPGGFTSASLTLGALATLLLGVAPQPLLDLANQAVTFVR
ncbi:NADH-quinone oxidoreductase subunit NuoN [Fodinicola acaciae]|uniref:NADH-quinone oxidoreductase subunit NuoN n=1 Tax=Fodinicola acaciae TaxID=2681555 RepID=UPI0013D25CDC|nr:NADH-quinone oxidoreductase subunit NuoN [Fodinicola acaciae]